MNQTPVKFEGQLKLALNRRDLYQPGTSYAIVQAANRADRRVHSACREEILHLPRSGADDILMKQPRVVTLFTHLGDDQPGLI
ncbi:hypothetical protein SAHY_01090 [Salinisphaera hydrothermalis EPR70]